MTFKENVLNNFSDLMSHSIADATPYKVAIEYVEDATAQGIVDDKEKVEVIANMMAQIVVGTTSKSMDTALAMELRDQELLDKLAILDEQKKQAILKTALETALNPERIESAQLDNDTKTHRLNVTMPKQDAKIDADKQFVDEQKAQLVINTDANKKIKVLDSFSDLFGTLGAGGLVVPDEGWSFLSDIGNDLTAITLNGTGFASGVTKK